VADPIDEEARALAPTCPVCDGCGYHEQYDPRENFECGACKGKGRLGFHAIAAALRAQREAGFSLGIRTACAFLRVNGHGRLANSVACQAPVVEPVPASPQAAPVRTFEALTAGMPPLATTALATDEAQAGPVDPLEREAVEVTEGEFQSAQRERDMRHHAEMHAPLSEEWWRMLAEGKKLDLDALHAEGKALGREMADRMRRMTGPADEAPQDEARAGEGTPRRFTCGPFYCSCGSCRLSRKDDRYRRGENCAHWEPAGPAKTECLDACEPQIGAAGAGVVHDEACPNGPAKTEETR
jgi:hypothetical protein